MKNNGKKQIAHSLAAVLAVAVLLMALTGTATAKSAVFSGGTLPEPV